ncbi:hypothetical protein VSR68_03380 [Paraburkholderia phymatum]|uniref:hypothetical protein n=1 Tax=Paraburkholderia phymatum TaxID=148447 RepID=UPI00317141EE
MQASRANAPDSKIHFSEAQSTASSNAGGAAEPGLEKQETKHCKGCDTDKTLSEFYQTGKLNRYYRRCKTCVDAAEGEAKPKKLPQPIRKAEYQPPTAADAMTAAQRQKNRLANLKGHKYCDTCGAYLASCFYRTDPNGLFNLSDTCKVCETIKGYESGQLRHEYPTALRAAIDREHEKQDKTTPDDTGLWLRKPGPLPDHERYDSGWPCNPFTGKRAPNRRAPIEQPSESEREAEIEF